MLLDNLNLNNIRIFETVFRTRSMTGAAKALHMTQSGVSQHIKSLEDGLGIRLFDRIQRKLVPTSEAAVLYRNCAQSLTQIEEALQEIKGSKQLFGTVSVGLPVEFGNNIVLPSLQDFCKKHPGIRFKFELNFASQMNEMLLKGDLDFAFVDSFAMDKRIVTERVYDEELELCASEELLKKKGFTKVPSGKAAREFFESLDYVEYQDGEPVLRLWFNHHYGMSALRFKVRATVTDAQSILRLIQAGVGAGILPGHLLASLKKHKIHRFEGSGKPLKNAISLAYLRDRSQSPAASELIRHLKSSIIA